MTTGGVMQGKLRQKKNATMKWYVYKKRYFSFLRTLYLPIVVVAIISVAFLFTMPDLPLSELLGKLFFAILLVTSPFYVVHICVHLLLYRHEGSIVRFEDDIIKCMFFKRLRRAIRYDEVVDYGSFTAKIYWHENPQKFIYVSRTKLSDNQRNDEAYRLYKKTKDVLILEYNDEAMGFLGSKCPEVKAWDGPHC